jgi:hypothetical protein
MKRVLISLAASAAILSLSTGAYACAKLDTSSNGKNGPIILAQATGGGTSTGGPTATTPEEQVKGTRKTDTAPPAVPANPNATDTTGATGTVDASQSKRKETTEPTQSGTK